jgi:NTE family protein
MYTNLVFEGGGVLGAAFAKIPLALREHSITVERVSGSSAGSIAATLIALRYSPEEISDMITGMDFNIFRDDIFSTIYYFFTKGGLHSGYYVSQWIKDRIMVMTGNPNTTFAELYEKTKIELVITGTNVTNQKTDYFSHKFTPNMKITRQSESAHPSLCILYLYFMKKNYTSMVAYSRITPLTYLMMVAKI